MLCLGDFLLAHQMALSLASLMKQASGKTVLQWQALCFLSAVLGQPLHVAAYLIDAMDIVVISCFFVVAMSKLLRDCFYLDHTATYARHPQVCWHQACYALPWLLQTVPVYMYPCLQDHC